jgi:ribosome recycling factor
LQKNAEVDVQKMTDAYVRKIDELFDAKEKEIMTV